MRLCLTKIEVGNLSSQAEAEDLLHRTDEQLGKVFNMPERAQPRNQVFRAQLQSLDDFIQAIENHIQRRCVDYSPTLVKFAQ